MQNDLIIDEFDTLVMEKESGQCGFPLCKRITERNGLCFLHAVHHTSPKEKAKPKPIPKESPKRKKENQQYRKIVGKSIEADDRCHVLSPDCTGMAEGMNHKQKRSTNNLKTLSNLEHCCNACNSYIELNTEWAVDNGHQVSRFAIIDTAPFLPTEDEILTLPEEIFVEGDIKTFAITINNNLLTSAQSLMLRKHAEIFMWGAPGLGSLQLALAILLLYMPANQALHFYKAFEASTVCAWRFGSFEETVPLRQIIKQLLTIK